jgi:hypothetical protein
MLTGILGGYFLIVFLSNNDDIPVFCVFKAITGIPCPGCGMGRGTLAFVHGEFWKATLWHPLAIPFNIFLVVSFFRILYDLIKDKQGFYKFLTSDINRPAKILLAVLILLLWIYNIWRGA